MVQVLHPCREDLEDQEGRASGWALVAALVAGAGKAPRQGTQIGPSVSCFASTPQQSVAKVLHQASLSKDTLLRPCLEAPWLRIDAPAQNHKPPTPRSADFSVVPRQKPH